MFWKSFQNEVALKTDLRPALEKGWKREKAWNQSIFTGTKLVPLRTRKIFFIQIFFIHHESPTPKFPEIVVVPKVKNKNKPEPNLGPFNLITKCFCRKIAVIVEQSRTPIIAKSAQEFVITMQTSFFALFSFFGLPDAIWLNSWNSLTSEPLLEGLLAKIHVDLSSRGFGRNWIWDLRMTHISGSLVSVQ